MLYERKARGEKHYLYSLIKWEFRCPKQIQPRQNGLLFDWFAPAGIEKNTSKSVTSASLGIWTSCWENESERSTAEPAKISAGQRAELFTIWQMARNDLYDHRG